MRNWVQMPILQIKTILIWLYESWGKTSIPEGNFELNKTAKNEDQKIWRPVPRRPSIELLIGVRSHHAVKGAL